MYKILNLTFPRSGHHFLVRILKQYFKDKLKYCEYYSAINQCGCFGGENPRNVLCTRPETNFQKHHDFDRLFTKPRLFVVPKTLNRKYLILYRKKWNALISWYEMFLREDSNKVQKTEDGFREFMNFASNFYDKWITKWVKDDKIKNKLIITYNDIIDNTVETLSKVVNFCGEEPDIDKLKDAIIQSSIKEKRNIKHSKRYDILKKEYINNE